MTAVLANRVAANRLVATPVQAQAAIGSPHPDVPGVRKGSLGLSMQASEGWANLPATTRPPQRVQPEAAKGRLATGRARQSGPSQPAGLGEAGAGVQ
jgi:hypothetical protein